MKKIVILTESGADLSEAFKKQYGIYIVPMHVIINNVSLNDGEFPVREIFDYYETTKRVPSTSAVNPEEYRNAYLKIREAHPNCEILHLCYSAITTATWQNSIIASEDLDFVIHVDAKSVTAGLGNVVLNVARYYERHPEITVAELAEVAQGFISRARMMFIPSNLEYLVAGGRLSNAAFTIANILNIKPVIEMLDGRLLSTQKYRGSLEKVAIKFLKNITEKYKFESVYLLFSEGLSEEMKCKAEQFMREQGYEDVYWVETGGVISTHGGPGAIGIGGIIIEDNK